MSGARLATGLVLLGVLCVARDAPGDGDVTTRLRVDIGIVASDPERSVAFYTGAIGFRELGGFSLSGRRAKRMGLSSGEPLEIRVLAFDDSPLSTRLKIIGARGASPARAQDPAVSAHTGLRYMTVFVADWQRAIRRLDQAGVTPSDDVPIGGGASPEVSVAIVRDPDGNVVELVGPRGAGDHDASG